jgi:hypothetical protein
MGIKWILCRALIAHSFLGLLNIMFINIILSGDNAVVIATAAGGNKALLAVGVVVANKAWMRRRATSEKASVKVPNDPFIAVSRFGIKEYPVRTTSFMVRENLRLDAIIAKQAAADPLGGELATIVKRRE